MIAFPADTYQSSFDKADSVELKLVDGSSLPEAAPKKMAAPGGRSKNRMTAPKSRAALGSLLNSSTITL